MKLGRDTMRKVEETTRRIETGELESNVENRDRTIRGVEVTKGKMREEAGSKM